MSMNIKLIAPNGEILDSDSMSGNEAYVSDTATETGTYTLVVYEWHQDNEGDYSLSLN